MEWQQRDALTYKPRKYYLNTISPNCLSIFNLHHLITLPLNPPFWQDIRLSSDPCLSLPKLPAALCFDPTVLYPGSGHPPGEFCCHFPAPRPACSYLWSPPGSRTHGYWLGQCPPRQVKPKTGVLPKHSAAPHISSYAPSWMNHTPKDKSIYEMRLSEDPLPFLRKEVNLANRLPCCLFQERIKGIF